MLKYKTFYHFRQAFFLLLRVPTYGASPASPDIGTCFHNKFSPVYFGKKKKYLKQVLPFNIIIFFLQHHEKFDTQNSENNRENKIKNSYQ